MKHIFTDIKKRISNLSFKQKILLILIVAALGFVGYKVTNSSQAKPQYQTTKVTKGEIISTLSESGTIVIANQTNVNSPTDGILQEVYVKNGDVVNEGENLFKVKSTATAQEKASTLATYLGAANSEKLAETGSLTADAQMWSDQQTVLNAQNSVDYKNNNTVNPSTKQTYTDLEKQSIDSALTIARKQFSASEQKFKEISSSINAAKAQLTSSWLNYQNTQDSIMTAPSSGTVANFSAGIGGNVSAGNTSSTGTTNASSNASTSSSSSSSPVLILGDFSNIIMKAQVSEVDVSKVKNQQKVTITLDAFPGKTFVGEVSSIDTIGTNSSGVVSYNVYITLIAPPSDLMSGMTSSAIIQMDRKDNVLKVPSTAIQSSTNGSSVRVLKNNIISQVSVEIGIASDSETEITSGLQEGQTVITSSINSAANTSSTNGTASPFGASVFGGRAGGFGGGNAGRTSGTVRTR